MPSLARSPCSWPLPRCVPAITPAPLGSSRASTSRSPGERQRRRPRPTSLSPPTTATRPRPGTSPSRRATPTGEPRRFDGFVRLSVQPGTVLTVDGAGAVGRNVLLNGGKATGTRRSSPPSTAPRASGSRTSATCPRRPGTTPAVRQRQGRQRRRRSSTSRPTPAASSPTTTAKTAAPSPRASRARSQYALPKISDVQGDAAQTPYPIRGIEVNTAPPRAARGDARRERRLLRDRRDRAAERLQQHLRLQFLDAAEHARLRSGDLPRRHGERVLRLHRALVPFVPARLHLIAGRISTSVARAIASTRPSLDAATDRRRRSRWRSSRAGSSASQGFTIAEELRARPRAEQRRDGRRFELRFRTATARSTSRTRTKRAARTRCDADADCSEFTAFSARGDVQGARQGRDRDHQINTQTVAELRPARPPRRNARRGDRHAPEFLGRHAELDDRSALLRRPRLQDAGCGLQHRCSSKKACVTCRTLDDNDQGTN